MDKEEVPNSAVNLNAFKGDLRWLVDRYVEAGDLPSQEAVDEFENIMREAYDVDPTGDHEARAFITTQSWERLHKSFDIYNDPEDRFFRKDIVAGNLMQGLLDEERNNA